MTLEDVKEMAENSDESVIEEEEEGEEGEEEDRSYLVSEGGIAEGKLRVTVSSSAAPTPAPPVEYDANGQVKAATFSQLIDKLTAPDGGGT